jgi:hypothetical protein
MHGYLGRRWIASRKQQDTSSASSREILVELEQHRNHLALEGACCR